MDIWELFKKWTTFKKSTSNNNIKVEDLFGDSNNIKTIKTSTNSDLNINSYWDKKEDWFLISLVNDMFLNAIKLRASDIHIEPNEKDINIRFRIDW